jgi:Aldehyde dehydrogenase family
MPFGGYKASGVGRDSSEEALHACTQVKVIIRACCGALLLSSCGATCLQRKSGNLLPNLKSCQAYSAECLCRMTCRQFTRSWTKRRGCDGA